MGVLTELVPDLCFDAVGREVAPRDLEFLQYYVGAGATDLADVIFRNALGNGLFDKGLSLRDVNHCAECF